MRISVVLAALTLMALTTSVVSQEKAPVWPPLPQSGFIKGRTATKQDVETGVAAFFLESNGVASSKPLNIEIPQYALLRDDKTGAEVAVIIIQGETNGDMDVIGYIAVSDNQVGVAMLKEFRLLGTNVHKLPTPNNALRSSPSSSQ